ncbi:MAG: CdaR family protein [Gammaproteobacteria bacterium]
MTRLFRDWPFKLLALGIAVTIWTVVVTRDRGLVAASVSIEYVGLSPELMLTDPPRDTIDVEVAVARWAWARFRPDGLRVRVDLSRAGEGERVVAVSARDVQTPGGVRVRRVEPSRLRVQLERAAQATLPVVAVIRGTPAPGHRVAAVRVDPITVVVKGPRSTIETRESVRTTPVDVAGHRSSVTQSVELAVVDAQSAVTPGTVMVTVDIQAELGTALQTEGSRK